MAGRRRKPQAEPAGDIVQQPGAPLPAGYGPFLEDLKARIRAAQVKAALSANRKLIELYLRIGRALSTQAAEAGWGDKVVECLSRDLRAAFPSMSGLSRTNLFYMKQVYEAWSAADESVQQLVGLIPWGHHLVLLTRIKDGEARAFYLRETVAQGWSRAVLTVQIESRLCHRQGMALTNVAQTLPPPQSDLAQHTLKAPYVFDFLTLRTNAAERNLATACPTGVKPVAPGLRPSVLADAQILPPSEGRPAEGSEQRVSHPLAPAPALPVAPAGRLGYGG